VRNDAAIVEVGLNEAVSPSSHARVPQSPNDCAVDALLVVGRLPTPAQWKGRTPMYPGAVAKEAPNRREMSTGGRAPARSRRPVGA
jgi:hypothetical protein